MELEATLPLRSHETSGLEDVDVHLPVNGWGMTNRCGPPPQTARLRAVNRLTLERHIYIHEVLGPVEGREELVVPIIDGTPLHEMVDDRLPGLALSFVAPPSRQWLGAPTYEEGGRAVILDGTCGTAECCGVLARITVTEHTVQWSDFFGPGDPPLPPGMCFEFDRPSYEATVNAVTSSPERIWTVTDDR
jgi:hypothetical protein